MIEDAEVKQLLEEHEYLEAIYTGDGDNKRARVRCALTQHEMLPRKDAIETHLKSKKFIKAKEWYCYDYSQYEPYIVAHRRKAKSLFCNVTNTILNRIPSEVEKHVKGKKFQRLKEHVKFTQRKEGEKDGEGDDDGDDEEEFDANAFEFENSQVLLSDDDEDEGGAEKKKKSKKAHTDSDSEDEEDDEEDEDDEDAEESDLAEFYPDEDDEDRIDHETVVRLTQKKRKAGDDDEAEGENKAEEGDGKARTAKKQKKATVSSARMNSKQRRQMQPKQQKASFKK